MFWTVLLNPTFFLLYSLPSHFTLVYAIQFSLILLNFVAGNKYNTLNKEKNCWLTKEQSILKSLMNPVRTVHMGTRGRTSVKICNSDDARCTKPYASQNVAHLLLLLRLHHLLQVLAFELDCPSIPSPICNFGEIPFTYYSAKTNQIILMLVK